MDKVQKAIENITHYSRKFPAEDLQILCEHPEGAKPYLYKSLDYIIEKEGDIEDDYNLHFYAVHLLAEFQDREAFERIVAIASLPPEILAKILGDIITEGLKDILYLTYNGNLQLLKDFIKNPEIDEFACMAALYAMGQLYRDGDLGEAEWKAYLREVIALENDISTEVLTSVAGMIYKCHFIDMLPDLSDLFEKELINRWVYGDYDDFIDYMFDYRREGKRFCKSKMSVGQLNSWAMYDKESDEEVDDDFLEPDWPDSFGNLPKRMPVKNNKKIGRNDPCPCGSGKKYKQCCLNKPKTGLDAIESEQERKIRLKHYPETGVDKVEGRLYLEDFYDPESIEIDKMLYLAFKCKPSSSWYHNGSLDDFLVQKRRLYLWEGFLKYKAKIEKEGIETNEAFDNKYSIHYKCQQWQSALLLLLQESEEDDKYQEVLEYSQK